MLLEEFHSSVVTLVHSLESASLADLSTVSRVARSASAVIDALWLLQRELIPEDGTAAPSFVIPDETRETLKRFGSVALSLKEKLSIQLKILGLTRIHEVFGTADIATETVEVLTFIYSASLEELKERGRQEVMDIFGTVLEVVEARSLAEIEAFFPDDNTRPSDIVDVAKTVGNIGPVVQSWLDELTLPGQVAAELPIMVQELSSRVALVGMILASFDAPLPPTIQSFYEYAPQYLQVIMTVSSFRESYYDIIEFVAGYTSNDSMPIQGLEGLHELLRVTDAVERSGKRTDWAVLRFGAALTELAPLIQDLVDIVSILSAGGSAEDIAEQASGALMRATGLLLSQSKAASDSVVRVLNSFNAAVLPYIPSADPLIAYLDEILALESKIDEFQYKVVSKVKGFRRNLDSAVDRIVNIIDDLEDRVEPKIVEVDGYIAQAKDLMNSVKPLLDSTTAVEAIAKKAEEVTSSVLDLVESQVQVHMDDIVNFVTSSVDDGLTRFRSSVLPAVHKLKEKVDAAIDYLEKLIRKSIGKHLDWVHEKATDAHKFLLSIKETLDTIIQLGSLAQEAGRAASSLGDVANFLSNVGSIVTTIGNKVFEITGKVEEMVDLARRMSDVGHLTGTMKGVADDIQQYIEDGIDSLIDRIQAEARGLIDQGRALVQSILDRLREFITQGIRRLIVEVAEPFKTLFQPLDAVGGGIDTVFDIVDQVRGVVEQRHIIRERVLNLYPWLEYVEARIVKLVDVIQVAKAPFALVRKIRDFVIRLEMDKDEMVDRIAELPYLLSIAPYQTCFDGALCLKDALVLRIGDLKSMFERWVTGFKSMFSFNTITAIVNDAFGQIKKHRTGPGKFRQPSG